MVGQGEDTSTTQGLTLCKKGYNKKAQIAGQVRLREHSPFSEEAQVPHPPLSFLPPPNFCILHLYRPKPPLVVFCLVNGEREMDISDILPYKDAAMKVESADCNQLDPRPCEHCT